MSALHETQLVTGLPGPLPPGEVLLWQGQPCWRVLARRAFHVRGLALYFGAIVAWCAVKGLLHGTPSAQVMLSTLKLSAVALVPIVLLGVYAWLTARTTMYTITSRRVVMKFGLALPMMLNLPLRTVAAASLNLHADAGGDVALSMFDDQKKLSYFVLWPHARPWRIGRPEPTLRALPDAHSAADILAGALLASEPKKVRMPAERRAETGTARPRTPIAA